MNPRITALVVLLLVGSLPAGIVGASAVAPSPDTDAGANALEPTVSTSDRDTTILADADDVIHRTTELHQRPDRPGEFEATVTVDVPEPVSSLEIDLEDGADVQSTDGFEATPDGTYEWTGETDAPTLRFVMDADRTTGGHHDDRDGYTFRETGEWGVVQVPRISVSFQKPAGITLGVDETVTVDGEGAAGDDVAYFGPVTEYERTVDGETIRLAVGDDADMHEDPDDVLDALASASERLDVGGGNDEVFVVAVPSDADWGPRGLQAGDSDAWVRADAPLEEAPNVWLHEYVHTRQSFVGDTTPDAEWIVEGQADYYAGLLAYEQGLITFGEFRDMLERGERSPYADDVLADQSTWTDRQTPYAKGALVYGELDRQVRLATDGDGTGDDVFRLLNAQGGDVDANDVLAAIEATAGEDVSSSVAQDTQTTAVPDAWDRGSHHDAFDRDGASMGYGLGEDSVAVADRDWDRWDRDELTDEAAAVGEGDVLAVPAGERVTIPVALENTDAVAGTVDATLQVDGEIVALERRGLAAGETGTATLEWTPSEPGVHDVRVGDDRLTVFVRSAPSLSITGLSVDPDSVDPGETTTGTATVEAADAYPAAAALEFRTATGATAGEPIALAPGEQGAVDAELTFDDEGRYEVTVRNGVDEHSTTVAVGGLRGQLEALPGFGPVAGLVAVALALAAVVGRRR